MWKSILLRREVSTCRTRGTPAKVESGRGWLLVLSAKKRAGDLSRIVCVPSAKKREPPRSVTVDVGNRSSGEKSQKDMGALAGPLSEEESRRVVGKGGSLQRRREESRLAGEYPVPTAGRADSLRGRTCCCCADGKAEAAADVLLCCCVCTKKS